MSVLVSLTVSVFRCGLPSYTEPLGSVALIPFVSLGTIDLGVIVKYPSFTTNVTFVKLVFVLLNWVLDKFIWYVPAAVPFASAFPLNVKSEVVYLLPSVMDTSYPVILFSVPS